MGGDYDYWHYRCSSVARKLRKGLSRKLEICGHSLLLRCVWLYDVLLGNPRSPKMSDLQRHRLPTFSKLYKLVLSMIYHPFRQERISLQKTSFVSRQKRFLLVDTKGIEPSTLRMRTVRSPSWATRPYGKIIDPGIWFVKNISFL